MNIRRIILLAAALLIAASFRSSAQSRVTVLGTSLGTDCTEFVKALKRQGFKVEVRRDDEEDYFYGRCLEVFLNGEVDRCPAVIHVKSSQITHTVFEVELILREFIDTDEAFEKVERVMADIRATNRIAAVDKELFKQEMAAAANGNASSVTFVEMPSGEKHITKYMCYPEMVDIMFRFYETEEQVAVRDSYGSANISVCRNSLDREHLVQIRYYDINAAKVAESEKE